MLVMTNYAKDYASIIYQSLLTVCLFLLDSILGEFEGSLGFLHLGEGGRLQKPKTLVKFIDNLRSCCFLLGRDSRFELFKSDFKRGESSFLGLWFSFSTHTSTTVAILDCFARPPRVNLLFTLIHCDPERSNLFQHRLQSNQFFCKNEVRCLKLFLQVWSRSLVCNDNRMQVKMSRQQKKHRESKTVTLHVALYTLFPVFVVTALLQCQMS